MKRIILEFIILLFLLHLIAVKAQSLTEQEIKSLKGGNKDLIELTELKIKGE